jgi:FAD-linked oxidoreductase
MWRNWSRELSCEPAALERPSSVAEVSEAVGRAAEAGRDVRAAGAGHSFSEVALTGGTLLLMDQMDRVLDVDRSSGLVKVEAGISLHALSEELAKHGLAFENLGDIDVQTISGAISTGTHGTGGRLANLSSQVRELELVAGDGRLRRLSADEDPDGLRAARVGMGSLGIIASVTLRVLPVFTLHGIDRPAPLEETLDRLDELVGANEHFEFFHFPYSDLALTRTNNRTDRTPAPRGRAREYVEDVWFRNRVFELFCLAGRRWPRRIPAIHRRISHLSGASELVDRSYKVFATPRLVRFTEMEYAIPREHAAEAVRRVRGIVRERRLPIVFPIELRFVAPDDAFLSPAGGRDTAYVAVHNFRGMEWEPFFRAVEKEVMDPLDGRPHWGKRHFQTAETLRPRYPSWDAFQAVRARLDPDGRFSSSYVKRLLGPVGATVAA